MPSLRSSLRSLVGSYVTAFNFVVEIGGIEQARFTECSGLQGEVDVLSYEEGGCNNYIHKLPGRAKFSNITLKKGVSFDDELWLWFQGVVEGVIVRKNISVLLMDSDGSTVKRWNLFNAYPVKYVSPPMATSKNEVIIETIELAHEGMTLG